MKKALMIAVGITLLIVLTGIVVFLTARHLAYVRVERLTELHAHEFAAVIQEVARDQYQQFSDEPIDYYKVFHYVPDEAKLFVVVRFKNGNRNGLYIYLERSSGEWQIAKYELVWASYGSTDGGTWPPYW